MEEFKNEMFDEIALNRLKLKIFLLEKENLRNREFSDEKMAEKIKKTIEDFVKREGKL